MAKFFWWCCFDGIFFGVVKVDCILYVGSLSTGCRNVFLLLQHTRTQYTHHPRRCYYALSSRMLVVHWIGEEREGEREIKPGTSYTKVKENKQVSQSERFAETF